MANALLSHAAKFTKPIVALIIEQFALRYSLRRISHYFQIFLFFFQLISLNPLFDQKAKKHEILKIWPDFVDSNLIPLSHYSRLKSPESHLARSHVARNLSHYARNF